MQTRIPSRILATKQGQEADQILRNCVHCGFCTATCPTYRLFGDELDGPRGRIYLIKEVLEDKPVSSKTQLHLDRCLTCRSCETTCPSGVAYGKLIDIGRSLVDKSVKRPIHTRLMRWTLSQLLPYPKRMKPVLRIANAVKPILSKSIRRRIPQLCPPDNEKGLPPSGGKRRFLILDGCIQQMIAPATNEAARNIFARLDIELVSVSSAECCGAICHHLDRQDQALMQIRKNVDAWWPEISKGAEGIVFTASGCGTMIKEYGDLLAGDEEYATQAKRISELACDASSLLAGLLPESSILPPHHARETPLRVAFQSPCSLQHGLGITGTVEDLLNRCGYQLLPVQDSFLCCGSAGTYSILQPGISRNLRKDKTTRTGIRKP